MSSYARETRSSGEGGICASMISSLAWMPRGRAKAVPSKYEPTDAEMAQMRKEARMLGAAMPPGLAGDDDWEDMSDSEDEEAAAAEAKAKAIRQASKVAQVAANMGDDDLAEYNLDDYDDDYFDALDEQLEQLGAPPDPDKSLADRFGGHPLPLDHVARLWPRDANFQPRTCHYHPGLAGDRLNGGLVDSLTKIGEKQHAEGKPEWGATYAYELRTLVAACSYMADAFAAQKATSTAVNSALRAGHAMPDGLESLPQDSLDMAVQLQSVLSHLKERVDVLRATARQGADVEILARLYDSEERIAGDRSELGAAVEARALEGATRNMIAAAAKERVAAATGAAHLTPRGPPSRERTGGGREPRSARDRARRLQPVATSARPHSGPNLGRSSGQQTQQRTATPRATSPTASTSSVAASSTPVRAASSLPALKSRTPCCRSARPKPRRSRTYVPRNKRCTKVWSPPAPTAGQA